MSNPDIAQWFRDLAETEWELVEEKCFACSGKGAVGPGTTKGCCIWHQPVGLSHCNHCNGTGKIKMPRAKEKRMVYGLDEDLRQRVSDAHLNITHPETCAECSARPPHCECGGYRPWYTSERNALAAILHLGITKG